MEFFNELGKKVSRTSQDAIKKTKNIADTAKLSSQISDEEKKISGYMKQIGQVYYEKFSENPLDCFIPFIEDIQKSKSKIEEHQLQINKIKGITICKECKSEVPADTVYCSSCGTKLPQPDEEIIDVPPTDTESVKKTTFCKNCGTELPYGSLFCNSCGSRMNK